jgi:hypothetical protein
MAVVNNGQWVHLQKKGDEFSIIIRPQPGELSVQVRFDNESNEYNTMLKYRVD